MYVSTSFCMTSTLLAVTVVPVLCSLLVRGPFHAEDRNIIMRVLLKIYDPALNRALKHRKTVISAAAMLLATALLIAFGLPRAWTAGLRDAGWTRTANLVQGFGKEFMPPLNEGGLLYMPVLLPKTSLTEIQRVMAWQDQVMAGVPEIETVAGKLGRFETPTDPAPTEMLETTITLKPEWISTNRTVLGFIKLPRVVRNPAWREGMTVEKLKAELTEKMKVVPGYVPAFLQPIENRILMLYTGIRAQVGVKIYGDNLDALQQANLTISSKLLRLGYTSRDNKRGRTKP
mgnify:CR=1 FL=1